MSTPVDPEGGLLLTAAECAILERPLLDALNEVTRRNGAPPARLAALVADVHRVAARVRARTSNPQPIGPRGHADMPDLPGPASSPTSDEWLSSGEAAEVLGVSARQVRRLANAGALYGAREAGRGTWRISAGSAAAWLAERAEEVA